MSEKTASINPFNVSRDELLNLAAEKLVEQLGDTEQLWTQAESMVSKRVNEVVCKGLKERVDAKLNEEMERVLSSVVTPVTIWGEREGQPTTLKAILSERAKKFWEVKVDSNGNESSWGGEPRYEKLMKELLRKEFDAAVKNNAELIVSEFKKALTADAQRIVAENIEKLIKIK